MKLALSRELPGAQQSRLEKVFDSVEVWPHSHPPPEEALRRLLSQAEVAICMLTDKVSAPVLGDSLKCLITYSVGTDHIDKTAVWDRGIRLVSTPDVLTDATADLAWSLLMACARRLFPAQAYLAKGLFTGFGPSLFLGKKVSGATLGILGMGRIGKAVAQRARGFGMEVLYLSRSPLGEAEEQRLGVKPASLNTLLAESDFLSLHCPLTKETHHLIGASELEKMKSDAVLVNTARGPVVDERALVAHLNRNNDFYAGLDVFEQEPELAPGLLDCPNAICLPHIGSGDRPTREHMAQLCVDEAIRFAKAEPLQYELKR